MNVIYWLIIKSFRKGYEMYLEIGTESLKMNLILDFYEMLQIEKLIVKDYPYEYIANGTCISDYSKVNMKPYILQYLNH